MDKKYTNEYFIDLHDSIAWFEDGTLNAAYNVLDHNIESGNGNKTALIYQGLEGKITEFTFFSLVKKSNKAANYMAHNHVEKGDRVFLFLPQVPELLYLFLGIIKMGGIAGTLFSALGEAALRDRLHDSEAKIVFTTKELLPRIENIKGDLPKLQKVVVVDDETFQADFDLQEESFVLIHTKAEDAAYMFYTADATGKPKGIVHTHYSIIQQVASAKLCLDIQPEDVYWCTAEAGWITGIVYGMISNWALGVTTVMYGGKFDADAWYKCIEKHKITVWYTLPSAIHILMAQDDEVAKKYDLSSLRYLASVGEPLNPEAVTWGNKTFGKFFHDTWLQTETGSIMIANTPEIGIHAGSMGKPLPWVEAAILDEHMEEVVVNEEGNLCIKTPWPSLMQTIWNNKDAYEKYFKDGWYISGDKAKKDEKGYFWFIGREEDIITLADERVSSFEAESALVGHPSVVEAGVIGKHDSVRGEIIKAFIVLKPNVQPSDELKHELQEFAKQHQAGHIYPHEIEFIDRLPKTQSGKITRSLLRTKEEGKLVTGPSAIEG